MVGEDSRMTDLRHPPTGLFLHPTRIWFDELDPLGVLHHSRFVYHLERAQKAMFSHIMGVDTLDPLVAPDVYSLVRNLEMNYTAPVVGECDIVVALAVVRLRAAGLTTRFSFRSPDGSVLYCHGTRTVCRMDADTKAPAEWTPEFRARYAARAGLLSGLPAIL